MQKARRFATTFGSAIAVLALYPALALAADRVPDLKGKWVGKAHAIVAGSGTSAEPVLLEKDLVIEVRGQEGRRFWAVATLSGNGEKKNASFIGALTGRGNRTIVSTDASGYLTGQLVGPGKISFCYAEPVAVSCSEVTRTR